MPFTMAQHTVLPETQTRTEDPVRRFFPVRRPTEPADGTPVVIGFGGPVRNELPPTDVPALLDQYSHIVDQIVGRMPLSLLAAANLEAKDLRQEGLIGLLTAAKTFDRQRGARFAPFARTVVSNAIYGALRHHDPLSESTRRDLRTLARYREEHTEKFHTLPTFEQSAIGAGLSIDRIRTIQAQAAMLWAIQMGADDNADGADPTDAPLSESMEEGALCHELTHALAVLDERAQRIVLQRSAEGLTVRQVAQREGISIGRVSQIHSQALKKLKIALMSATCGVSTYLGVIYDIEIIVSEHLL